VDVVAWVDENYRTVPEASARASVGQGFGAVAALIGTFGSPGLVGKLATQSAFLLEVAWGPLKPMIGSPEKTPVELYLEWGEYDLRSDHENWNLVEANREAADTFRSLGYRVTAVEVHDSTGWTSWRQRTGALLEALFGTAAVAR
jgi:enterochelin esterase-like enzyme